MYLSLRIGFLFYFSINAYGKTYPSTPERMNTLPPGFRILAF